MNDSERIADLEQQIDTLKEAVRLLLRVGEFRYGTARDTFGIERCVVCKQVIYSSATGKHEHAPDCGLERVRRLVLD